MLGGPPLIPPPFPLHPPIPFGPGITPYNSNNVGPGFDAHATEFQRLQQDALNSPNFALDYLMPEKGFVPDPDAYNYGGPRPGRIF